MMEETNENESDDVTRTSPRIQFDKRPRVQCISNANLALLTKTTSERERERERLQCVTELNIYTVNKSRRGTRTTEIDEIEAALQTRTGIRRPFVLVYVTRHLQMPGSY